MTPPTAPPVAPRPLLRSRSHRLIAGVAGGLGQYLRVDAVVVRLGFVVLTLVGGLGALLYLAAWLIVPEDASDPEQSEVIESKRPANTWMAVGAIALLILLGGFGRVGFGTGFRGGVVWPLALIVLGAAVLWMRNENARVATAPTPIGTSTGPDMEAAAAQTSPTQPAAPASVPVPSTRTPRQSSLIRRAAPVVGRVILVGLVFVVAVIASLLVVVGLEGADALNVTAFEAAVVSGVVLGFAIWLGFAIHRIPELVAVALAVALVFGAAAWLQPPLQGGYGTRDIHPENAAAVHRSYQLAAGRLRLDLSDITLGRRTHISMKLGLGLLQVVVPHGTTVILNGHVGAGEICAFGRRDSGTGITRTATSAGGVRTLHLEPRAGAGNIVVARTPAGLQTACG